MIAPFDIFRVDAPDDMLYIEAAADIETAKARVAALMQVKPEETRLLAENFGAVRMLDKTKLCDELIPAILQTEN
jgi:hypothetical protein